MSDLRRIAILGLSLVGLFLSTNSAFAFLAYISNEKGNSVSVIDTDKMQTIATVKTGQRPRGIEVSRDGKSVFVALGGPRGRRVVRPRHAPRGPVALGGHLGRDRHGCDRTA